MIFKWLFDFSFGQNLLVMNVMDFDEYVNNLFDIGSKSLDCDVNDLNYQGVIDCTCQNECFAWFLFIPPPSHG